jgi:hypothetical protein
MKTRYTPLAVIVASCAGLALALGQTQVNRQTNNKQANSGSFIASVTGDWKDVNDSLVKFGQPVNKDECLYGETEAGAVVVEQAAPQGGQQQDELLAYTCDASQRESCPPRPKSTKAALCTLKVGTKSAKASEGMGTRLLASLMARLYPDPDKYMIAASRGLEAELDEAVVPLTGSQLDLSASFKDMDDGDYRIVLAPLNGAGKSSPPIRLRNKRGAPALVPNSGISPALYNVILVDQDGAPLGDEAWALVRSPDTYAAASSDFSQLVADSEKWPAEMDPSATRAILRAYLDQLAGTTRTDHKQK